MSDPDDANINFQSLVLQLGIRFIVRGGYYNSCILKTRWSTLVIRMDLAQLNILKRSKKTSETSTYSIVESIFHYVYDIPKYINKLLSCLYS